MKPRTQYSEIPPELIPKMEEAARRFFAREMGVPLERLKRVKLFDPGMEGRTGAEFIFEPDLTPEEEAKLERISKQISAHVGARPPIIPGKA